MLCFFRKLPSYVKVQLSCSYCTNFYGCKLWSHTSNWIFCTAWRKYIRLIWNLPPLTQCICWHWLAVFNEICRRSLNFTQACVKHESPLIRSLAFTPTAALNDSFFCENICFAQIDIVSDILQGSIININSHVHFTTVDAHLQTANLLSELFNITDGRDLSLANMSSG